MRCEPSYIDAPVKLTRPGADLDLGVPIPARLLERGLNELLACLRFGATHIVLRFDNQRRPNLFLPRYQRGSCQFPFTPYFRIQFVKV